MRRRFVTVPLLLVLAHVGIARAGEQTPVDAQIESILKREALTKDNSNLVAGRQAGAIMFVEAQKSLKAMAGPRLSAIEPITFTTTPLSTGGLQFEGTTVLHTIHGLICNDVVLKVIGRINNPQGEMPYFVESVTLTMVDPGQCV